MICKTCHKTFDTEFGICPLCGNVLVDQAEDTEKPADSPESLAVSCPNCGRTYDREMGMCPFCGSVLAEAEPDNAPTDDSGREERSAVADNAAAPQLRPDDPVGVAGSTPWNRKKMGWIIAAVVCGVVALVVWLSVSQNAGVSMSQIEKDVRKVASGMTGNVALEDLPNLLYTVDSFDVEKRKTDTEDKTDIVYCNIVASNAYYRLEMQQRLKYTYYTQGGWLLDNADMIRLDKYPIAAPAKDIFSDIYIKLKYKMFTLTKDHIEKIEFEESMDGGEKVYIATLKYVYKSDSFDFSGEVPVKYSDESGWSNPRTDRFKVTDTFYRLDSFEVPREQEWISESGWSCVTDEGKRISISDVCYVDEKKADDVYSWKCAYIIPCFNANLKIDKISSQTGKVSGKLIITEKESISNKLSLKTPTLEIPFDTVYDQQNGSFTFVKRIDAMAYKLINPYKPFRYKYFGDTIPVDLEFTFQYDVLKNRWDMENKIKEIHFGPNEIVENREKNITKAAEKERER